MYKCLNPGTVGIRLPWEACLPLARDNGFEGIDLSIRVAESLNRVWTLPLPAVLPETMKAVATGSGKAWLVDLPVPRPEGNQVIVKIHSSPICGSNMSTFHGNGEWASVGHVGFGEVQKAFEVFASRKSAKVLLKPWE